MLARVLAMGICVSVCVCVDLSVFAVHALTSEGLGLETSLFVWRYFFVRFVYQGHQVKFKGSQKQKVRLI